jgi:predicted MFS family arabinose efflux permease
MIRLSPVATFAATTTAGYGVLFYAYGVLLVPMEESLGWERPFFTFAFSLASVIGALLTVPIGRSLDRRAPRRLLLPGAVLAVVALVGWSNARTQAMFLIVWIVLGACQAILFYEPAFTILTKWYDGAARHRAVTSVTLLGGLASTIFGPLTAALSSALGWRGAVVALAGILATVTVPGFLFGLEAPAQLSEETTEQHVLPRDAFRDQRLWLITTTYLLSMFTAVAVGVLVVAFLRDRGTSGGMAATALGGIGLVQVVGRGAFSRLAGHVAAIRVGTWVMLAKAFGLILLLALPGPLGIVAFVVVYGAANGVSTLTRALSVAEIVGSEHYGSISGAITAVAAVGGALAPFVAALAIEWAGRPTPVWLGFALLNVAAAGTNALAARDAPRTPVPVQLEDADPIELEP